MGRTGNILILSLSVTLRVPRANPHLGIWLGPRHRFEVAKKKVGTGSMFNQSKHVVVLPPSGMRYDKSYLLSYCCRSLRTFFNMDSFAFFLRRP